MTNTKKTFNEFNYVKSAVLFGYYKNQEQEHYEIMLNGTYNSAINWLNKTGAVKIEMDKLAYDEAGKRRIVFKVQIIDLEATAISKTGKKYSIFHWIQRESIKRWCATH